jgi:hypothetical protein
MFHLSPEEAEILNRSQFVTASQKHRNPRYPPRAFTEHGVVMLANLLRSKRAVQVSIDIVRTFVHMRTLLATNEELARKVAQHDRQIAVLFEHVQKLLEPPKLKRRPIGYITPADDDED